MRSGLQEVLLTRFEAIREEYSALPDTRQKRELVLNVCRAIGGEYEPEVVVNLVNFVDHYFSNLHVEFDGLIDYLKTNNRLDHQTFIREERDGFDRQYGTVTSPILTQYEIPEMVSLYRFTNSGRYHPSPVSSVKAALERLREYRIRYEEYCFTDVGSGLGRNLLLATNFPFKRIIGIEHSGYLHEIAKANVAKYNAGAGGGGIIDLHCIDALTYQFLGENVVFYFWRPFSDEVAESFFRQVAEYYGKTGFNVVLIFLGMVYPAVVNSSFFRILDVFDTDDLTFGENEYFTISIYSR